MYDSNTISNDQSVSNWVDLIGFRTKYHPQKTAYIFLKNNGNAEDIMTYETLGKRAYSIAAYLQHQGCDNNHQRVVILLPPGNDFIAAYFGCMYAGAIPVPIAPVRIKKNNPKNNLLYTIINDAEPTIVITNEKILSPKAAATLNQFLTLKTKLLWFEQMNDDLSDLWKYCPIHEDSTAFIQYTSGSTNQPKGVMVSHANLLHNSARIRDFFQLNENSKHISWLPSHHDMGLIGGILQSLFTGYPLIFMPPSVFVQNPVRWLEAITRYKATVIGSPDFGYRYCSDMITAEQKENLDLSSLKIAFIGSEPVRADTIRLFTAAFESVGFKEEAFYPCYGLAEATLLVTGSSVTKKPVFCRLAKQPLKENKVVETKELKASAVYVGCGNPLPDQKLIIVDPQTNKACEPNRIGEIWVQGPSIAKGYWKQDEYSSEIFKAYTADGRQGPFLRTGDLGFLNNGELFITGRIKDLIIIRGKNYYPQDIEMSVEKSHSALRVNHCAAFSFDDGNLESLVVVQEVKRSYIKKLDLPKIISNIRKNVAVHHNLQVNTIVLIKPGRLVKTTSGKIKRLSCKNAFLKNQLDAVVIDKIDSAPNNFAPLQLIFEHSPDGCVEDIKKFIKSKLMLIVSSLLGMGKLQPDPNQHLLSLGMDSIQGMQLLCLIKDAFLCSLDMQDLFEFDTINGLSHKIWQELDSDAHTNDLPQITTGFENRYQPFEMTKIQEAYWVGRTQAFDLGNISAHVYLELTAENLDAGKLNLAWQRLIARHDMLRVIILPTGEQQIRPNFAPYKIRVMDLSHMTDGILEETIRSIRDEMSHQIFEPGHWPLFDIRITRLGSKSYCIHFSIDLIIADFFSLLLLFKEWGQIYQDTDTKLETLNLGFRDYVLALRNMKNTKAYQKAETFWRQKIPKLPSGPQLPIAREPKTINAVRFKRLQRVISPAMNKEIVIKAAEIGVTPTAIFLTAFAVIMATWSKTSKFNILLTTFNRPAIHSQINSLVGDFTSTFILPFDFSTTSDLVSKTKKTQKKIWRYLNYSFLSSVEVRRMMTEQKDSEKCFTAPVVFTSALGMNKILGDSSAIGRIGKLGFGISQTPQVWLDHQIMELDGAIISNWDYVEEIFPSGMIEEMLDAYYNILSLLLKNEKNWTATPLIVLPKEQAIQRSEINSKSAVLSKKMLHTAFLAQAAKQPEKLAIIAPDVKMTYAETLSLASQLGNCLKSMGAAENDRIAVVMQKGWEQVVAVLGVVMAGSAYLPIDPMLPIRRIHAIIADAGVKVAVTQLSINQKLVWPPDLPRAILDRKCLDKFSSHPPDLKTVPENLAYVIYTSGSTGTPKGVKISHTSVLNTILDINSRFKVNAKDKLLSLSALSFDLSVYDIFGMLTSGGTVVMPEESRLKDPGHWAELIQKYDITIWNSVPAFMQMMTDYHCNRASCDVGNLRMVMLSGDWIPVSLPDRIKQLWSKVKVIGLGGATEASIWSNYYEIEKIKPDWKSIPYGKPLANQSLHIYNDAMLPCPVWVPGQIYIGGIGLSLGYMNDAQKTAQSFITHPHTKQRLYRTGDYGRYLPDGNIEFLGRKDCQVKVMGHRIELGEIEAVLKQHPIVSDAIIQAQGNKSNYRSLGAFIIGNSDSVELKTKKKPKQKCKLDSGKTSTRNELYTDAEKDGIDNIIQFLRKRLPEYMIPSSVRFIDRFPLTSNGKIDRKKLKNRHEKMTKSALPARPEMTNLERVIARIVQKVLETEYIDIESKLFELGANSVNIVQILDKIQSKLDVELPINAVITDPTIRSIASGIEAFRVQKKFRLAEN